MAIGRPIELTPNIATKNISAVATADQTEFTVTGGYRINEIAVYRNGVRLAEGRDFTASDGDTVNLVTGATVSDVIEFAVFDSFNVSDAIVSAASSQSLNGDFNVTGKLYAGTFAPDNIVATAATFNSTAHVGSALTADAAGNLNTIGIITAASFSGDGSALTGLANTAYIVSVATTTGDLKVGAAVTVGGIVNIDATTDSTSTSTGALIVDGGVGIAKNVYIGAGLSVAGTLTYEDVTNVDSVGLITAKSGVNVTGGQLTVGSGITMGIAGVATFSGTSDVHLHDNVEFKAGDGSDLRVYHNGSHSYIDFYTGNLNIRDTNGNIATFNQDGAVSLYHDNNLKFATTNDGVSITGISTATVGIDAAISVWTLGANSTNHYTFTGPGNLSATDDPTLNLIRGQKYTFKNRSGGHPFRIQSTPNGSTGTQYSTGVTNNDGGDGTNIIFDVPYDAPAVLYYQCTSHANMGGVMYISGSGYETKIGTGVTIGSAGVSTFSGTADIHLHDNVRLNVGDGSDLAIYHDGTNSYISDTGTGSLIIKDDAQIVLQADILRLKNEAGNNSYITADNGAAVGLRYNNTERLTTTDSGTVTTGIATATSFSDSLGALRDIPLRSVTGSAATLVVADAGKVVSTNTTGWTVPASTFSEGDTVTLLNNSAGGLTITCSAVTTYLTSDGSTVTSSTLGARGLATLYFVSASVAYLQGTSLS